MPNPAEMKGLPDEAEMINMPVNAPTEVTDAELSALLAQIKPELDATLANLQQTEMAQDKVSAFEIAA